MLCSEDIRCQEKIVWEALAELLLIDSETSKIISKGNFSAREKSVSI